jgi:hypothetical protein
VQVGKESVEEKYEGFREAAREHTSSKFPHLVPLSISSDRLNLTSISDVALAQCSNWNFPWRRIVGQARPYLRRFEIALWSHGDLLGLAIGRSSRGPDNVTVHFMERSKKTNPLAGYVSLVALDAADNYAKILGRRRVKLKSPHPEAIPKYESLGFSLAESYRGVRYYARSVVP